MISPLKYLHTGQVALDRLFSDLITKLNDVFKRNPQLDSVTLTGLTIDTSKVLEVPHTLNREYQDWEITRVWANKDLTTAGVILESDRARPASHLRLRAIGYDQPVKFNIRIW